MKRSHLITAWLRVFAFTLVLGSCRIPDYHEVGIGYEDHPFWKQTSTGEAMSIEYRMGWDAGGRR